MEPTVTATIISAIISGIVSWAVSSFTSRHNDKSRLDNELNEILRIGIERPYLEQVTFTGKWEPKLPESNDRYATYDLYATLVFNYLEKVSKFYGFNYEKIQNEIDMDSWVKIHQAYWNNPTQAHENILGYDLRFERLIDERILRKGKVK